MKASPYHALENTYRGQMLALATSLTSIDKFCEFSIEFLGERIHPFIKVLVFTTPTTLYFAVENLIHCKDS